MAEEKRNIIIYNTADGKAKVALYAKDGMVWMNQNQLAELLDTSKQNIGQHITTILEDKELDAKSVVKNYFTTAISPMCKFCTLVMSQDGIIGSKQQNINVPSPAAVVRKYRTTGVPHKEA